MCKTIFLWRRQHEQSQYFSDKADLTPLGRVFSPSPSDLDPPCISLPSLRLKKGETTSPLLAGVGLGERLTEKYCEQSYLQAGTMPTPQENFFCSHGDAPLSASNKCPENYLISPTYLLVAQPQSRRISLEGLSKNNSVILRDD